MVDNQPPSEEEVDRMVELYDELGTMAQVADHDDIDYAKSTVSKWIRRRQEQNEEEEMDDEPEPPEGDYTVEQEPEQNEPAPEPPIEEQFDDILEDEPPTPNDILWDVLSADPDLKDKHVEYLRRFEDQYGVFSPDDVSGKLSELKITNKRMTINRAVSNYRTEINRKLQKNEDLAQREEWALLLTKTTGNPRYLREADGGGSAAQFEQAGPAIEGPAGGQQQARGDQIQAPAPGGQQRQSGPRAARGNQPRQQRQQGGIHAMKEHPQQEGQVPAGGQPDPMPEAPAGSQQQGGAGRQSLDPFEERLLEMLEQQMDDGAQKSAPSPDTSEADSLSEQIQEIAEIQQTLDQMGDGGGQDEELTQAIQQVNEQVDQKLARLEAKVSEMDGGGASTQQQPVATGGEGGIVSEIAALSQTVDDPEVIGKVIESQMDPEVIKAKAETEEAENDAKFKRAIAEAVSPTATEKAVDALMNLTSGLNSAAQQAAGQPQPQQPTQTPRQQQAAQPQQEQGRGVEVVEDDQQQAEEPAMSDPVEATEESSPLREQGEEELAETDTTDEADEEVEE